MLEEGKTREAKMEDFKGKREKGEKPSKEEMLKMKNDRLDKQIEMKKKMKTILDEKQYEKWENNQAKRKDALRDHNSVKRSKLKQVEKKSEK